MDKHPITPPPELVSKWCYEDGEEIKSSPRWFFSVCAKAAQWGADQQLAKDAKWLDHNALNEPHLKIAPMGATLKEAMRPKLSSLKERALQAWDAVQAGTDDQVAMTVIRRALEALPE